jgi:hypothetical protein
VRLTAALICHLSVCQTLRSLSRDPHCLYSLVCTLCLWHVPQHFRNAYMQCRLAPTIHSTMPSMPASQRALSARNRAPPFSVRRRKAFACVGSGNSNAFNIPENKHVVVIGGTGRVGSSTASTLLNSFPHLQVSVAGRSRTSYEQAVVRRPALSRAKFLQCDINGDKAALKVQGLCCRIAACFSRHLASMHLSTPC